MISEEKKQKQNKIKNKIILSAEKVFYEKGYKSATMNDIVQKSKFTKRTIYSYFSSKKEIYFAVTIKAYDVLINRFEQSLKNKTEDELDSIKKLGYEFWLFKKEYPHYFQAIIGYQNEEDDFSQTEKSPFNVECYELGEKAFGYLMSLVELANKNITLNIKLTTKQTALFLWSSLLGIFNTLETKKNYLLKYFDIDEDAFINTSLDMLIKILKN
jgi:AcrR family transcriptional regulator